MRGLEPGLFGMFEFDMGAGSWGLSCRKRLFQQWVGCFGGVSFKGGVISKVQIVTRPT